MAKSRNNEIRETRSRNKFGMTDQAEWVTLKELAELEGRSNRAIVLAHQRNRYTNTRKIEGDGVGRGGWICQVHIEDPYVSAGARKRLYEKKIHDARCGIEDEKDHAPHPILPPHRGEGKQGPRKELESNNTSDPSLSTTLGPGEKSPAPVVLGDGNNVSPPFLDLPGGQGVAGPGTGVCVQEMQDAGCRMQDNTPLNPLSRGEHPSTIKDKEIEAEIYAGAPEWARKKAEKYLGILRLTAGMRGRELREFLEEQDELRDKASYKMVVWARRVYNNCGAAGLLSYYGKRAGETRVRDIWFSEWKTLYLKEGGPSIRSCWIKVLGTAIRLTDAGCTPTRTLPRQGGGESNGGKAKDNTPRPFGTPLSRGELQGFPSPQAFWRRLKREVPKQAIYMARHGGKAWNRKFAGYVDRDYSSVGAGDVWVSDHAQIDVAVFAPHAGLPPQRGEGNRKVVFPWVTAWRDFKSGKILGFCLHPEPPNSDHVFQSFYRAAVQFGLPKDVYIDNGKDYRCKDFAGGRKIATQGKTRSRNNPSTALRTGFGMTEKKENFSMDEGKATAMLSLLSVTPHFALPYNPQAKTIERDFLKIKEGFSKHMVGYRGGHVKERPESLQGEIKRGNILSWEEFVKVFNEYVVDILNKTRSSGKVHQGRSPDQVWAEECSEMRSVSKDALKLFCMRTSRNVTIRRNGIVDKPLCYWGEWMVNLKGEKVYMRRDPEAWQEAWVFEARNDAYLGKAMLAEMIPALARTDMERQKVREAILRQRRERKIIMEYGMVRNRPSAEEIVSDMAVGVAALGGGVMNSATEGNTPLRGHTPESPLKRGLSRGEWQRGEENKAGQRGEGSVTITVLANTAMDKAVLRAREMEREGTYDLSPYDPGVISLPEKHLLHQFEYEVKECPICNRREQIAK